MFVANGMDGFLWGFCGGREVTNVACEVAASWYSLVSPMYTIRSSLWPNSIGEICERGEEGEPRPSTDTLRSTCPLLRSTRVVLPNMFTEGPAHRLQQNRMSSNNGQTTSAKSLHASTRPQASPSKEVVTFLMDRVNTSLLALCGLALLFLPFSRCQSAEISQRRPPLPEADCARLARTCSRASPINRK